MITESGPDRIGKVYQKALYREYTDSTFTSLKPRPAGVTDRLEELLPNVERVRIPSASHLMHEENAPATSEAILDFLGRRRSPTN